MKISLFYCTLFMLCSFGLFAQKSPMKASSHSKASYVRNIPALSKMDNIISAKGIIKNGSEKRRGKNTFVPGKGLPAAGQSDPLAQVQQKSTKAAISTQVASFDTFEGFSTPTDPTGAIGPNHYVYAFNTGFGIRDRNGNVLLPEASLATLFPNESDNSDGDPIVVYDNFADRFVIMQFFGSSPSEPEKGFLIAVSQGPDPINDGWFSYRFDTDTFPDYEKLSIWSDGYYITANKDQNSPDVNDVVFALERDLMLVGDPNAQMIGFPLPGAETNGFYSPGGSNATGINLPPVGVGHSILYLQDDSWAGVNQDHIKVWTTDVDWANPANSTISQPQEITTAPFDSVFDNGSFSNLEQPSGPDIDALQATMMYMTHYRRFGTHNSIVLNFAVDLDGTDSLAGIRWYELRQTADGQPWTIYQEGTYAQPDGLSAFCGSMAMDAQGNIGLGYTVVSTSVFPSLRYTGRLASDPLGTMTAAEQVSVNGNNPSGSFRYGDYGQMTIDPLDDMTFWYTGEYFGTNSIRKNYVVAFKLEPEIIDNEAPTAPTNLTAIDTTARQITLQWNSATDNIGVTSYDVYRDATLLETVTDTVYVANRLTPLTTYEFFVVAKDASNNESPASNSISVTTLESTTGPGCVDGLLLPYVESFESGIGAWTQDATDDLDWLQNSGGTPSRNTGPSSADDGVSYLFVEASGNGTGFPQKRATLNSPCFDLNDAGSAVFSFRYHMFGGTDFGSLALEATNDEGVTWTSIWSRTGNQGNSWQTATVDLADYIGSGLQLRFVRVTGSTWQADAAIDKIELSTGSGSGGSNCATGDITVSITFDNYPEETSWALTDAVGTVVASESYSASNPDGSTVTETISGLATGSYTFTINDAFGDGICCEFGNGSYTVSSSVGEILSGGDFTDSESTDFCVENTAVKLDTYDLADITKDDSRFVLSPNPVTRGTLNISVEKIPVQQLEIFSMFGQKVYVAGKKDNTSQIDVSALPSGTYFARITAEEAVVTRRFIIK